MQHGLLFSLFLSLSLVWFPVSAVEISPANQQQLIQDGPLQQKVAELIDYALKDDIDGLAFAMERISLPQQEAARFLLLQYLEKNHVALSSHMVDFVERQKNIAPVYQVLEKGEGYEFSVPAFDYIAIAHRLTKQWHQDQQVIDFAIKAESQELILNRWLSGPEFEVQEREALLISQFDSLSAKAITTLVEQLTQVKVVSWLPSTSVMIRMAQVSGDPKLYKLLWLMRADFFVEQELERLSEQGDNFAIQQMMVAASNPRLTTQALQSLVKINQPLSEDVKNFLVKRLENAVEAPIVAQALAEQGYHSWLKEILVTNRHVESRAILQVLSQ